MTTQRKIFHLLQSEGTGKDFRYLPALRAPINLGAPILVTEKVDGSTLQSTSGEPWKRFDRMRNGDPRKHIAREEERYELRPCNADDPGMKWYLASFNSHREQLERFGERYPHRWIYFEALGAKIGSRYKELDPTIRVFDTSENGVFLPFSETIRIAEEVGLPLVAHQWKTFGDLDNLFEILLNASSEDGNFPSQHQLEGWVLRQNVAGEDVVAKIRVADLRKIK